MLWAHCPVQSGLVWSGPVLNLSPTSTVRENDAGRAPRTAAAAVSNTLKQNTYLKQPAKKEPEGRWRSPEESQDQGGGEVTQQESDGSPTRKRETERERNINNKQQPNLKRKTCENKIF